MGLPGAGKTTLARVLAERHNADVQRTSGPLVTRCRNRTVAEVGSIGLVVRRLDPVLGGVVAGQAVSCRIRVASSRTAQCSTPLPSTMRMMCICL